MKRNYNKNIEQGIQKTTLLSSTIIIVLVATIIGFILINTEYNNFKKHIQSFKTTLIDIEKFNLKTSVQNIQNDIKFEEVSIINSKKNRIKNQSIIAYNLAKLLYKKTNGSSKKEQINLIISSLNQLSQKENDINYFILDKKGNLLLNTSNKKDIGVNFLDFEDVNGVKFINKMISANDNKQNFIEYYWYKPSKKITYSRHLKELGIIIGSGSFLDNKTEKINSKIINKIFSQSYKKENYIFIYKINSLNKITKQSQLLLEKHIISSEPELKAMKSLLIESNYKGNDYTFYENNQKLFYGTFIKELRYFVATGVNLSSIYNIVEKEREISLDNMYKKIIKLSFIIAVITLIFFVFSLIFTQRIKRLFSKYRNIVKQNEEKYALLFNYSNDGFIISEINEEKTNILSLNKTALKIIDYDLKEILYRDFFKLFEDLSYKEIMQSKSLLKTVKLITKNDEIRTIELSAIVYNYDNQELLFASLRDITERTLLKQEKQKQERILIQKAKMAAMGEMIGNIAHQWRQPLTQVSGLFLDLESAYEFKELDKKYLSNTVNQANDLLEYMSETIDDFRNFFNPNNKKEEFFIKDAVLNAINILNKTLDLHNIELQIEINEHYKILGYKNEYSQAILNIISNAKDILIEKNINKPKISIYLEINKDTTLYIEDNAGGINKEIISKIFDPYFTTKYEYGTGIGLYMTKLIIEEKMNGTIFVKNSNNGAIFSIKI